MNSNRSNPFSCVISELLQKRDWHRFDKFLIRFLGYGWEGEEPGEEIRRKAYRNFLKRCGEERCASLPTIRKWFGIEEFHMPTRTQVYGISLTLNLTVSETERFLKEGILEPSFQICDYHELIAMYALENRLGKAKAESLTREYEQKMGWGGDEPVETGFHTEWLFRQYEHIKKLPEQGFLEWMWEHRKYFKGYSKTLQNYLEHYKEKIIELNRAEARNQLDILLSETGYPAWLEKKKKKAEEGTMIRRYMAAEKRRKKPGISRELRDNIRELTNIVYSERNSNSYISGLFSTEGEGGERTKGILPRQSVKIMSDKYISDLFHIPERNERFLKVRSAISRLEQMDGTHALPKEFAELAADCTGEKVREIADARECLERYERENKRRRLMVQRNDLLSLSFCVSQQTYLSELECGEYTYRPDSAKKAFTDRTNATLLACGMDTLDERYLFDSILLACYQEDKMYGYEDVLNLIGD